MIDTHGDKLISYNWLKSAGYEIYKKYADDEDLRKVAMEFEKLINSAPDASDVLRVN